MASTAVLRLLSRLWQRLQRQLRPLQMQVVSSTKVLGTTATTLVRMLGAAGCWPLEAPVSYN